MSDSSDEGRYVDGDRVGWDARGDPDQFVPPDPTEIEDQEWMAAQFARDAERMLDEPQDVPVDDPPELTAEEFAREILDGGADAAADLLGSLEPGPRAAALLAMLKPASLSPASMVSVVAATERLASWVQACQHRWLATFACPGTAAPVSDLRAYASQPGQPLNPRALGKNRPSVDDDLASSGSAVFGDPDVETVLNETAMKVAAAEVGAALHFSPIAAQRRVCQAVEFAVDLPATLRALECGSIDRGRSLTIADRTQNLPVELRRRVEQAVLPKATTRTPGQLRGIVDRAVISVDPAAAKKRHEKAIAQRNVTHRAAEDGMGVFRAELSADKAQLAYGVIDQLAYQLKRTNLSSGDPRGVGALRADVFSDLIDQLASTGTGTIRSTLRRRAPADRVRRRQATANNTPGPACEPGSSSYAGEPGRAGDAVRPESANDADGGSDSKDPDLPCGSEDAGQPDPCHGADEPECRYEGNENDGGNDDADEPDRRCEGDENDSGNDDADEPDRRHEADEHARSVLRFSTAESAVVDPRIAEDGRDFAGESFLDDFPDGAEGFDQAGLWVDAEDAAGALQSTTNSATSDVGGSAVNSKGVFNPGTGLGAHQGRVTHLNVTVAASTLAGLDDRPGDLDGHGPIPADLARAIAASASTIAVIAIRPGCGTGLDLGRTVYRPRLAQRDHVTIRDQTCRFPGCRRQAKRCQIDHSDEFCPAESDGGVTCPCNLQCLCVFHHGLKTGGLWDCVQHSDASVSWTSPTGRSYLTQPRQWPTTDGDSPVNDAPSDARERRYSADGRASGAVDSPPVNPISPASGSVDTDSKASIEPPLGVDDPVDSSHDPVDSAHDPIADPPHDPLADPPPF